MYHAFVRPLLFRLDPERVHHLTMAACSTAGRVQPARRLVEHLFASAPDPRLMTSVGGVRFPNPVGLGAGYDKNAEGIDVLARLGFGYLDIGSVSLLPSAGNTVRPRLHRLPADEALMVNYGVPSDGSAAVARRLAGAPHRVPVGITVVETNTGRPGEASAVIDELTACVKPFLGLVDLLFISAACPNSAGAAQPFSDFDNLQRLFESLSRYPDLPPVFLKIRAREDEIERIVEIASMFPFVKGFRPELGAPKPYTTLRTPRAELERMPGTATGPLLHPLLLERIRMWYGRIDPTRHALIANGGIRSGADAYAAIRAGASLVGLVTALVYEGPGLARRINAQLAALLARDGFANVAGAVGADHPRLAHHSVGV